MTEGGENTRRLTIAQLVSTIRSDNQNPLSSPGPVHASGPLPYVSESEGDGEESFNYDSDGSPWKLSPLGGSALVMSRSSPPGADNVANRDHAEADILAFFRRVIYKYIYTYTCMRICIYVCMYI